MPVRANEAPLDPTLELSLRDAVRPSNTENERRLPYLRRWLYAFLVAAVAWVVVAHFAWRDLAVDVRPLITRLLG